MFAAFACPGRAMRRAALGAALLCSCAPSVPIYLTLERERIDPSAREYWVSALRDARPAEQRESAADAARAVRALLVDSLERTLGGARVVGKAEAPVAWDSARADALFSAARERGARVLIAGELFSFAPRSGRRCSQFGISAVAYDADTQRELWRAQVGEFAPLARCSIAPERWAEQLTEQLVRELGVALSAAAAQASPGFRSW